ncbi:hypothetical protein EDD36DRAFT_96990 [Exophiala viscosa]|uniref:Uncharacterized protein n=1 Tax=Exophiala viscosa TaxID=2486360 RepID=A0AAN6DKP3_9EURO|nr:hypothetical protein EDD36DRAFT_96990 [Exophiala viscosa]
MDVGLSGFTAVNVGSNYEEPEDLHEYFSLQAPPNSNIQRKPAALDDTTAPMMLKRLNHSFLLAEVTVSADFAMDHDQAGLVIFAGALPSPSIAQSPVARRRSRVGSETLATGKWAKAGLEFARGELHAASSVAISTCGADWCSSARMPSPLTTFDPFSLTSQSLRIRFERVEESLWISYEIPTYNQSQSDYYQDAEVLGSRWKQMREIMGFFGGVEQKGNTWVGCYASRPMDFQPSNSWEEVDELIAEFEDLDIL